jgi:hypothetical protein
MRAYIGYIRHANGSASSLVCSLHLSHVLESMLSTVNALERSFDALDSGSVYRLMDSDCTIICESVTGDRYVIESMSLVDPRRDEDE